VVVEGAHPLEWLAETQPQDVRVVPCADWVRGPGASLRCGLTALTEAVEVAVVVLADGPKLAPAAIERTLAAWEERGGTIAASYGGARGHPLVLGRDEWSDIPNVGLRDRPVALVPCDDLGAPGDVDRPEDLDGL
jgi:CTP:molybdopterin cytidylyltransferase MocA